MASDNEEKAGITSQILFILGIWLITIIFGFFPLLFKVCKKSAQYVGIANAFSGGIFLGIGLFHLFPESGESFEDYFKDHPKSPYAKLPNNFFLAFMSYSLILLIEKVFFNAHKLISHDHDHDHAEEHEGNGQHAHNDEENPEVKKIEDPKPLVAEPKAPPKKLNNSFAGYSKLRAIGDNGANEESIRLALSNRGRFASFMQMRSIQAGESIQPNSDMLKACEIVDSSFSKKVNAYLKRAHEQEIVHNAEPKEVEKEDPTQVNLQEAQPPSKYTNKWTPYVLLIALTCHGFFEGIALGIQSKLKNALFFFIAIIAHKWAEAFTLGTSFHKAQMGRCMFISLILIFSLITPAGAILGLCFAGQSKMIEGIFLGLSAGTFLYVSATEVIVEEFSLKKNKWWKFLVFIIGAFITAVLKVIEDEEVNG